MPLTQTQIDATLKAAGVDPTLPLPVDPLIAAAMANLKAEIPNLANSLNANLIANYQVTFTNFANQVELGKIPNTDPPQPPPAWEAVTASNGMPYVLRGTDPVEEMPPIPPMPTPAMQMVVAIGARIGKGSYWAALPSNANVPNGYQTLSPVTAADGAIGFFEWEANPFGGYWLKIA